MNDPKCPTGYTLGAHENKACNCVSQTPRNLVAAAMHQRYRNTTTTMRDRRERRSKDARRSWRNEEH